MEWFASGYVTNGLLVVIAFFLLCCFFALLDIKDKNLPYGLVKIVK